MKNKIILAISFLALTGCGRKEREAQKEALDAATIQNSELMAEIIHKDSIMNDALFTISDISATLSSIKAKEGIIINKTELGSLPKDQIKEDLELISELLEVKKRNFAALQKSIAALKESNQKVDGLTKLMEQMQREINERDSRIKSLLSNIDNLKEEVKSLNKELEAKTSTNLELKKELTKSIAELNRAYYIIGEEKELVESGILVKKGGIMRTLVVNPEIDKSKLVEVNIQNLDKIEIKGEKIKLVGNFSSSTYTIISSEDKKRVESIYIDNKDEFWKNSKILVISYK